MHRLSAKKHARAGPEKTGSEQTPQGNTKNIAARNAELALQEGDVEKAQQLCQVTTSLLDRAAGKGVIKKGTANRQKSRITRQLNALTTQSA